MNAPTIEHEQLINNFQIPAFLVLGIYEKYLEGKEVNEKLLPLSDQNTD